MAKNDSEETIIARGVRVEGDFVSQGDVYIEGEVNGNVKTSGDLRLGSNSKISASVTSKNAVVSGRVTGNLEVSGRLDLLETAWIDGDIKCETMTMAPGAKLSGRITMNTDSVEEVLSESKMSE